MSVLAPVQVSPARPGDAASRARRRGGVRESLLARTVTMSVLVLCAVYFAVPVYWVMVSATKNAGDLFGSFGLWFAHPHLLDNLAGTFTYDHGIFLRWLVNSVVYAGVSSVVATLIAAAAGYALAQYTFRGRELIFSIILAGVMVPGTATALPLYLMMSGIHLNNTYWSVLLPSCLTPFGVYLSRVYTRSAVPPELIDAARCDGAGEARIFFTIVLRIMTPAVVTIFLFHFVGVWNNYLLPLLMLANNKLYPLTLGLTQWNSDTQRIPELYPLTVTGAFVSLVMLGAAILSLQRFWTSGLLAGSLR